MSNRALNRTPRSLHPRLGVWRRHPPERMHVTIGTLRCEIPVLEPDDDFVDRLAELAAASRPGRGRVVVPVAFGGPASRAVVIAATVAAVTAGAAAAATQLSDAHHDEPAPPGTSIGIQRPGESPRHRHDARATRVADHPTADDVRDQEDGQTQTDTGKTGDAPTTSEPASPVLHEPGGTGPGADDPSSPSEQGNQQGSDDPGDDNGNQSGPQDGDAGNDGGDNT